MNDDAIERWYPDPIHARAPVELRALGPSALMLGLLITFVAVGTRSLFPFAVVAFAGLAWFMVRRSGSRRLLTRDVAFELTHDRVRVRIGGRAREMHLADIGSVRFVRASRRADVGHVVVLRRGSGDTGPSIPTGRRVSAGTSGLVTWLHVEHVDPAEQLFDGALTMWFVTQPERVCARLEAAVKGVSPHARGPHR